jgi:glutamate/tyrosine decarboxylase-like PLP-dependent enzyme
VGVVTFRYAPKDALEDRLDEINTAVSRSLVANNTAGILTTKVRGKVALRICALSPHLSLEDMSEIVKTADQLARDSQKGNSREA